MYMPKMLQGTQTGRVWPHVYVARISTHMMGAGDAERPRKKQRGDPKVQMRVTMACVKLECLRTAVKRDDRRDLMGQDVTELRKGKREQSLGKASSPS